MHCAHEGGRSHGGSKPPIVVGLPQLPQPAVTDKRTHRLRQVLPLRTRAALPYAKTTRQDARTPRAAHPFRGERHLTLLLPRPNSSTHGSDVSQISGTQLKHTQDARLLAQTRSMCTSYILGQIGEVPITNDAAAPSCMSDPTAFRTGTNGLATFTHTSQHKQTQRPNLLAQTCKRKQSKGNKRTIQ